MDCFGRFFTRKSRNAGRIVSPSVRVEVGEDEYPGSRVRQEQILSVTDITHPPTHYS